MEECRRAFPNIQWHKLDRTYVQDGINRGRALLGNAIIDSKRCQWLMECFENWEYRQLSSVDDWSANPKHDRYSHLMDAFRYSADFLAQVPYIEEAASRLNMKMPSHYGGWDLEDDEEMLDFA